MKIPVRTLKNRLSQYLRRAAAGEEVVVTSRGRPVARLVAPRAGRRYRPSPVEEAVALLRGQAWIRAGKGRPRLPRYVSRLKPGEKSLSEIVGEERG